MYKIISILGHMPQVTFMKINNDFSIPIKIFINRKKIIDSTDGASDVTINQKSIIKLNQINYLKLSPKDMNSLIEDLKIDVFHWIINKPLRDVIATADKGLLTIIGNHRWKYSMIISVDHIVNVRYLLNRLSMKEYEMLEEMKVKIPKHPDGKLSLLYKELHFTFIENEADDTEKKTITYNMKSSSLTNNLHNCLNVYINKIPVL